MKKIFVIGMGPGHPDYLLPAAKEALKQCDLLAGGARLIESAEAFSAEKVETFPLRGELKAWCHQLQEKMQQNPEGQTGLLLSGDTGCHSLVPVLHRYFDPNALILVPGISSIQLFLSHLQLPWTNGPVISLHGRRHQWMDVLRHHFFINLLTDAGSSPDLLAKELLDAGHAEAYMAVGENLSYKHQRLLLGTPAEIIQQAPYQMNVAVISLDATIIKHLQHRKLAMDSLTRPSG
ncbi:precorrin-6y C5,15-methyltransferase (decarboxylating) subunit CbiE [Tindallia californiensis]|uniref:Precorrin-6Y C5,15-methyltransferase (Decarboxylating) n=1 Tax=Tindallia californiensis TaxID=159292 RepID=A0A1H3PJ07_9FIRM|nr:precorrin-6y C5,15-methyltransferase (decarboxylating) subunit CbiE [Tindallia californiensis]SDZ00998.1 precorrin-6Y C5,15-methyltransferase (decarboxylating) [Tindallia californiensis]